MWVSQLAKSFGMNLNKLCEVTGYSRQYLHLVLNNKNSVCSRRWNAAMNNLENHVINQCYMSIKKAEEEKECRINLISKLRELGKK